MGGGSYTEAPSGDQTMEFQEICSVYLQSLLLSFSLLLSTSAVFLVVIYAFGFNGCCFIPEMGVLNMWRCWMIQKKQKKDRCKFIKRKRPSRAFGNYDYDNDSTTCAFPKGVGGKYIRSKKVTYAVHLIASLNWVDD